MSITSTSHNEGFAARWSRRKHESGSPDDSVEDETVVEEKTSEKTSEAISETKLAKLNALTDQDMPDVETLGEDSDYAGFMSINVSEALRKIALQKLFHGKGYNIRDGLDEYDGDYTSFEKLDPSIITADMKHLMEVEAEKLLAKEEADKAVEAEEELALAEPLEEVDEEALVEEALIGENAEVDSNFDTNFDTNFNIEKSTEEIT